MKFLISGISILALTQIIFDVLEAKHKSEKRRKMFQRILWQGSPIVLGMATLGLFYWRKKILTGKNLETGNNSSRFQVLDAKNSVLDQRYHRGCLDRAGVKISELDTPCPMGGCRSEVWKEPIILQNAPVEFLRVHWRTNCRDRLRYHHAWDLFRPLDRFLKTIRMKIMQTRRSSRWSKRFLFFS